jgi:beta-1,4-mannosyltransferase
MPRNELIPQTIAFLPDYAIANSYTLRMQEILASFGRIERLATKARLLGLLKDGFRRIDLVLVNWEENALVSKRTGRVSASRVIFVFLKVAAMKLVARRVAFVRHNHYPHTTRRKSISLARWLVDRYEGLFDFVFVHSGVEAVRRGEGLKRYYLPHPLYRRLEDAEMPQVPADLPERYFVVFGRIAPYKNLEHLMSNFPAGENLVVCGEVGDSSGFGSNHAPERHLPTWLRLRSCRPGADQARRRCRNST